jgi:hypothetical protein
LRAKLFALQSKETGWKERGVGTIKLNVPKACLSRDEITGKPVLDAIKDEEGQVKTAKSARLVMRQESTHRVILNTVVLKAMKFEEKPSNSAAQILFTAIEDNKPVNMLLKVREHITKSKALANTLQMSEVNARNFKEEIDAVQSEL